MTHATLIPGCVLPIAQQSSPLSFPSAVGLEHLPESQLLRMHVPQARSPLDSLGSPWAHLGKRARSFWENSFLGTHASWPQDCSVHVMQATSSRSRGSGHVL